MADIKPRAVRVPKPTATSAPVRVARPAASTAARFMATDLARSVSRMSTSEMIKAGKAEGRGLIRTAGAHEAAASRATNIGVKALSDPARVERLVTGGHVTRIATATGLPRPAAVAVSAVLRKPGKAGLILAAAGVATAMLAATHARAESLPAPADSPSGSRPAGATTRVPNDLAHHAITTGAMATSVGMAMHMAPKLPGKLRLAGLVLAGIGSTSIVAGVAARLTGAAPLLPAPATPPATPQMKASSSAAIDLARAAAVRTEGEMRTPMMTPPTAAATSRDKAAGPSSDGMTEGYYRTTKTGRVQVKGYATPKK